MRAYYIHALADDFAARAKRARNLGFSTIVLSPVSAAGRSGNLLRSADLWRTDSRISAAPALDTLAARADTARAAGMQLMVDVVLDRVASPGGSALDPRFARDDWDASEPAYDTAFQDAYVAFARGALERGVAGFRVLGIDRAPSAFVAEFATVRQAGATLLGWFPGTTAGQKAALAPLFDFAATSLPWWDFRATWFWDDVALFRTLGVRALHAPELPFGARLHGTHADHRARLAFAALSGAWLLPMGAEDAWVQPLDPAEAPQERRAADTDLHALIRGLNAIPALGPGMPLGAPGAVPLLVAHADHADIRSARDVVVAAIGDAPADVLAGLANAGGLPRAISLHSRLAPDITLFRATLGLPDPSADPEPDLAAACAKPRVAIEAVTPAVDTGAFAVKRTLGQTLRIEADIITDGHDVSAVALHWQPPRGPAQQTRMRPLGNDRYVGEIAPGVIGTGHFTVEAWRDAYGTYHHELEAKHAAGVDTSLELREGALLVTGRVRAALETAADDDARRAILLSDETVRAMAEVDPRPMAVRSGPYPVWVERTGARFASWYEVFPRSLSDDAERHGNFDDVIRHLPRVRAMGFDVLYFPPIHPIGHKNRKGRNNALTAEPGEPGSPYAIGNASGGHDALHPELGTFEDFARLIAAAAAHGLEVALDFAVQCAPDHPWLAQHKDWFVWRPDGSIRYAENPPKKYQDIVNVDFYAPGARPALWEELTRIVLFWCARGVKLFRVDNPHTKPFPFWEFLIGTVRARHPDAVFLAEAFTKPKVMARLAKVGFSQSYSYFTWRNTADELATYLTELQAEPWASVFRPHLFVNTPDINPLFLQVSGRAGHLIRAALAATLSGLWGVYSGFELCDATPLPGREEYLDSEKYQLRQWAWDAPGNIVAEITQLNAIRRANPALHTHLGVVFLDGTDPDVLCFQKATDDFDNVLIVAVTTDFTRARTTDFDVPLWRYGLDDAGSLTAENLLTGGQETWRGRRHAVTLTPESPYAIWRIRPFT